MGARMSRFTFLVEVEVINDMQGELGQEWAERELEGDLHKLPHNATIIECTDEEAD